MSKKTIFRILIFYGGIASFLLLPLYNYGQTIERQSISSYGSSVSVAGVYISQTGGQSYNTTNESHGNAMVLQGFQQSGNFILKISEPFDSDNLSMNLYPNPATHIVTISSNKYMDGYCVKISDSQGKTMLKDKLDGATQYYVNCDQFDNGIYFITVSNATRNSQTLKLIITK